ncbi:glycosyltransferase family 2 protein [Mesorhizobium sp. Root157]|uniref:glycosyltransferase family 2 protein n=1 Tax=Mesorhizobium sp. Root157 TaxID=1736477 RepID=UPI0009E77CE5|nr:glycosyltransferase family 2 protein [Mesorhizobium sp. Root157]
MAHRKIAVVIPSYNVRRYILTIIKHIGPEVSSIYVVDDACPEKSGQFVETTTQDPRVRVLYNAQNLGVGGATMAGMTQAAADGADVIIKIDGDGQMDPALIPNFANIILSGEADYAKGNRFFEPEGLTDMPLGRLIGNAGLSFLAKISSGYWYSLDPTNGFVAIHASLIELLPLDKISKRYFFESDLLFRLNILKARVIDVPMYAHYADEVSSMKPLREIPRFAAAHMRNFGKRIFYNYFVRNFSLASVELVLGTVLMVFGVIYGLLHWGAEVPATAGTVMIAALPIIIGAQLLLAFLNYDIQSVPHTTLHLRLTTSRRPMRALRHGAKHSEPPEYKKGI